MAEEFVDPQSKTEEPTPRRREEARRQGIVPFSAEVVSSVVLLVGVIAIYYTSESIIQNILSVIQSIPKYILYDIDIRYTQHLFANLLIEYFNIVFVLYIILIVTVFVVSIAQVGVQVNTEKLSPDFDRMNPVRGFQERIFSAAALVRAFLLVLKVAALLVVAYWVIGSRYGIITSLTQPPWIWSMQVTWELAMRLAMTLATAIVAIAGIDYAYQRYRHELSLRMTREEVKRELREEEGDPQIKARMRQMQRERARRRMLAEVPRATVVITNPLHYAVALRYHSGYDPAPVVVAKGRGLIAQQIYRLAWRHSVPVVHRPLLARLIFRAVPEGRAIPPTIYQAVAEILAFIYRLRGWGSSTADNVVHSSNHP